MFQAGLYIEEHSVIAGRTIFVTVLHACEVALCGLARRRGLLEQ